MTNAMINGFEERWLFVENKRKLRIGLRQAGEQVLFLMHGVTRCWRDWEPIIPFLDPAWTIFALDHRGHGESDRADSYFVRDYAKDLVEVLNQIVDTKVVLVGHSLGAMVAASTLMMASVRRARPLSLLFALHLRSPTGSAAHAAGGWLRRSG